MGIINVGSGPYDEVQQGTVLPVAPEATTPVVKKIPGTAGADPGTGNPNGSGSNSDIATIKQKQPAAGMDLMGGIKSLSDAIGSGVHNTIQGASDIADHTEKMWKGMNADQKMLALLAIGRIAAGSEAKRAGGPGAQAIGDYTSGATGVVHGMAEKNKTADLYAQQQKLEEIKNEGKENTEGDKQANYEKDLAKHVDLTITPDAVKSAMDSGKIQEWATQQGITVPATGLSAAQQKAIYVNGAYGKNSPAGKAWYKNFADGDPLAEITGTADAATKKDSSAGGGKTEIVVGKDKTKWEIHYDASGKPIGKVKVK